MAAQQIIPPQELSRLGRAALGYATRQHWPVFPVRPGDKTPAIPDWPNRATTDTDIIQGWWSATPDANVGLVTGQRSGVVVVDIDPRHGGDDAWADLRDLHGPIETLEAITGGGGSHIYLQARPGLRNTAGTIAPGIDTRGDGGYVLVPPSVTADTYEWLTHGIAPAAAPGWLLSLWQGQQRSDSREAPDVGTNAPAWTLLSAPIPDGQRNQTLTRIAGWLRLYHPEPVVNALLQTINEAKADPPLPPEEVAAIARSVCRYPQPGVNGHPKAILIPDAWRGGHASS